MDTKKKKECRCYDCEEHGMFLIDEYCGNGKGHSYCENDSDCCKCGR